MPKHLRFPRAPSGAFRRRRNRPYLRTGVLTALIGRAQAQTDATEQERHADQGEGAGLTAGFGELERAGAARAARRRSGRGARGARRAEIRRLAEAVLVA